LISSDHYLTLLLRASGEDPMPLEYFTPSLMTMFGSSAWRQLETVLQLDDMRQL
jgi:hypothetical protein